jgi:predicted nucleotidyltransferase
MIRRSHIEGFARRVAREFHPLRIILFGSHAYGRPSDDSDADILVVVSQPCDGARKAAQIRNRIAAGFPLDLLVRTDSEVRRRLSMGDFFIREIVEKGRVLYERHHPRMDRQGRGRLSTR